MGQYPIKRMNNLVLKSITVKFQPNRAGEARRVEEYNFTTDTRNTNSSSDSTIKDAYHLKSFLTYKNLLDIHHLKKNDEINLFNLLVNGVLKHFKYTLTGGKELGALWKEVQDLIKKETDITYNTPRKKRDVDAALTSFNNAFSQLFKEPTSSQPNPEYILTHAKPILDVFNHNIVIKLNYIPARPNADYTALERGNVAIELKYAGKTISKPHLFLNEARLSAIAISIYLGMIKRHPQLKPYKILFLDDVFIGLDIANRIPLLRILEDHFSDYQIFVTTYDKPWYEYAKSFLDCSKWNTIEFYAEEVNGGYEIPKIFDKTDLIQKSIYHYNNSDYKASAVYAHSAFEKIIMDYCEDKGIAIPYKKKQKDYSSQIFWNKVKNDVPVTVKNDIEQYRFLTLNSYSHYNPETNPFRTDLRNAITAVENLRTTLNAIR